MAKDNMIEVGQILLQFDIAHQFIKDIRIEEHANEHAYLFLRFVARKTLTVEEINRLEDTPIQLMTPDGDNIFVGICSTIAIQNEADYSEVLVTACSKSIVADRTPKTITFQGDGKTLQEMMDTGLGSNGIAIRLKQNVSIAEMLSQEKETDWAFDRRIANQYGNLLFVDTKSIGNQIHVGAHPFAIKELGIIVENSSIRNIEQVRKIQHNNSPSASVFEFENQVLCIYDLTIGAGYAVTYQGRLQTVTNSVIYAKQGALYNQIQLTNEAGTRPNTAQMQPPVIRSSILTGTVEAVQGNDVKVSFSGGADVPRWIPYANAVSNYFYCMPDKGDTVFVYYESGNSSKIVCLGSKHVSQSPDFDKHKNKMLTANNRMIKFADEEKELDLIGNHGEFIGLSGDMLKITFSDSNGIEIRSTKPVNIEGQNIAIQSTKNFNSMKGAQALFAQMNSAGLATYEGAGGALPYDPLGAMGKDFVDTLAENVKANLTAPLNLFNTLNELGESISSRFASSSIVAPEEASQQFTEGVVNILAMENLTLIVGQSCVSFGGGIVNIKTPNFIQLGANQTATFEHLEDANYTFKDMFLDATQLLLDIVGVLPIPGISTAANLINSGISLARGDYVGAAMSAGAAAMSLIPGGAAALAPAKIALATSKFGKVVKAVSSVVKVAKTLISGAKKADFMLQTSMSVVRIGDMVMNGEFNLNDPKCRQDVMQLVQCGGSSLKTNLDKKYKPQRDTMKQNQLDAQQQRRSDNQLQQDERRNSRCSNGEPVDMITGSFMIEQCDLIINDVLGEFALERFYESICKQKMSPIGSRWVLSIFSKLDIYDDEIDVHMPDHHMESFLLTENGWRNRRNGDQSLILTQNDLGYLLTDVQQQQMTLYDYNGNILNVADSNGNQRRYEYLGNTLQKISFASGQFLNLSYEGNKLSLITDNIGRTIRYSYEGDLLVAVEIPNSGVERYKYTSQGYVMEISNANGVTYVHNEYDSKGRVSRQQLSTGQEYIILYDDDNRTNTYLAPFSGKEIKYVYNKDHKLVKTIYQDGTFEEIGYDAWQNPAFNRDRNGLVTSRIFNEQCLVTEVQFPSGLVVWYEYDQYGRCTNEWNNAGSRHTSVYDEKGNLSRATICIDAAQEMIVSYTYDSSGRVLTYTDSNGHITNYDYGSNFNNPTVFTTPEGDMFQYTYDAAGRRMSTSTSQGTKQFAYDNMDLLSMIVDQLGFTTKYLYDKVFDLKKVVLPNQYTEALRDGLGQVYQYDAFHNMLSLTNELGIVQATLRDLEGNIIKDINPNCYDLKTNDGAGISYEYDAYDRKIKIIYPDGGVERIKYDARGNITKKIQPEHYNATNDDGAGHCYEYDAGNHLTQIINPDSVVIKRYVYDLAGNIIKEINANGYLSAKTDDERIGSLYHYNAAGWLLEKREPIDKVNGLLRYRLTEYCYDLAGNITKERRYKDFQDENSISGTVHTLEFAYDKVNRLICVSDCTGAVVSYKYNSINQLTYEKRKLSDSVSQIFRYQYDAAGRMIESSRSTNQLDGSASFATTKYTYDKTGNVIQIQLPTGGEILREYDILNRLLSETHKDKASGIENRTEFAYDKAGNLTAITDTQGRKTLIEYDLLNREIRRTEKDGGVQRRIYNPNGSLAKLVRPNQYDPATDDGAGYQYTYDLQGRVITVIAPNGTVLQTNAYTLDGQLLQQLDGAGGGASFSYDLAGNRLRIETKGGSSQDFEYDVTGNIIGIVDGNQNRTGYQLDKWGRITQVLKADGSTEFYTYDYAGNMTTSTDGENNTTRYEYNRAGLISKLIDPMGEAEAYAYDGMGRMVRKADRNGNTTEYGYTFYDAPLYRRNKATGLEEVYSYTPEGLLQAAIGGGMRYSYKYDEMGRLLHKSASGRALLSHTYDKNGNRTSLTDITGRKTEYLYNSLDMLTEVYDNGNKLSAYGYNQDGTVKSLQNGAIHTLYSYDLDKNMTSLQVSSAGQALADNRYSYDGNGNRLSKQQLEGNTLYTFDALNQLTKVQYPSMTEELFYSKSGNRTSRVADGAEELYQYDPRNRLTQLSRGNVVTPFRYDNAGNLLADDKALYSYDEFNRTTKVETIDGNVQVNRYDAEGLRHELEENGRLVQFIFNDNREVIAEQDENKWISYIRASSLLASSTEHTRTYYHYASDEMGSITHIVNGEGAVQNSYQYDAWGNVTEQEENIPNRFKFNGQQLDPISQQYYLRARFYNPVIARFTQEDTYRGDGLNLYAYCQNNPVVYEDPTGNACESKTNILNKAKGLATFTDNSGKPFKQDANGRWHDASGRFASDPTGVNQPKKPKAKVPNAYPITQQGTDTTPAEPYNRRKHYGDTPTAADRTIIGGSPDHDPPLVQRYYEGDPSTGEKPGYQQTPEERTASAQDRSRMNSSTTDAQRQQGGEMALYSRRMKKKYGL